VRLCGKLSAFTPLVFGWLEVGLQQFRTLRRRSCKLGQDLRVVWIRVIAAAIPRSRIRWELPFKMS
jgi:hypothetical protein